MWNHGLKEEQAVFYKCGYSYFLKNIYFYYKYIKIIFFIFLKFNINILKKIYKDEIIDLKIRVGTASFFMQNSDLLFSYKQVQFQLYREED